MVRLGLIAGDRAAVDGAIGLAEQRSEPRPAEICRAMRDDDPAPLLAAARHYALVGRRPAQAFVAQEAAVRFAQAGAETEARAAFEEALEIYDGLGASLDRRQIQARLRPYGIRRGTRAERTRVTTGWAALTGIERTVAFGVMRGESNSDIAARLLLSRRTIEAHVAHILRKLDVRGRVDIAREAANHVDAAR